MPSSFGRLTGQFLSERREKRSHLAEVEWHSLSWVPPRGTVSSESPTKLLGKSRRPSLVSGLRQNRILALFATHPLSASDQGAGTHSAGNLFMLLGIAT